MNREKHIREHGNSFDASTEERTETHTGPFPELDGPCLITLSAFLEMCPLQSIRGDVIFV